MPIDATIVHALTLLHPAAPCDRGRMYRCLTEFPSRTPGCLVPLSTLTFERHGGLLWPEMADWKRVVDAVVRLARDKACDAMPLGLPSVAAASLANGPYTKVNVHRPDGSRSTIGTRERCREMGNRLQLCRHPGTTAAAPGRRQQPCPASSTPPSGPCPCRGPESPASPDLRPGLPRQANPPQTARFAGHGAATPRSGQAADKDGHGVRRHNRHRPKPHLDRAVAAGVEWPRVSRRIKPEEDIVPARHRGRSRCLAARSCDVRSADQEGRSVMGTVVFRGVPNQ